MGRKVLIYMAKLNGKKIALLGAGPASLAVARDLIPLGYDCTIYEKDNVPGGLMRTNIPAFRLPVEVLDEECDLILVMSVNPGFGGQSFIDNQLTKVERIKKMILKHGYKAEIEVDGGVNKTNARSIISAGASILVAGNSVFKDGPERYFANIR